MWTEKISPCFMFVSLYNGRSWRPHALNILFDDCCHSSSALTVAGSICLSNPGLELSG
jgi:hypothetical protein